MKKINFKTKLKKFLLFGNSAGFTLIEVLASMIILSVGILGLASAVNSVNQYQNHSKDLTLATMYTTNQLENIKRFATNEPTGGSFGFDFLVGNGANDFFTLNGYTAVNDTTRLASVTVNGFATESVLTIYPVTAPTIENFTNPGAIRMVDIQVTTTWTNSKGLSKTVQAGTVLHRRQFIN